MKRKFIPYNLLILTAAVLGMVFSKIKKHDFYHHYFRVIGEVEVRNSKQVAVPEVAAWAFNQGREIHQSLQLWFLGLLAAFSSFLFRPLQLLVPLYAPSHPPGKPSRLYQVCHPTRAP